MVLNFYTSVWSCQILLNFRLLLGDGGSINRLSTVCLSDSPCPQFRHIPKKTPKPSPPPPKKKRAKNNILQGSSQGLGAAPSLSRLVPRASPKIA